jgi:hypothetical protein
MLIPLLRLVARCIICVQGYGYVSDNPTPGFLPPWVWNWNLPTFSILYSYALTIINIRRDVSEFHLCQNIRYQISGLGILPQIECP